MANARPDRPDQSSSPAPFVPPPRPLKKAWETKLTRSMPAVPFYKDPPVPPSPASSSPVEGEEETDKQKREKERGAAGAEQREDNLREREEEQQAYGRHDGEGFLGEEKETTTKKKKEPEERQEEIGELTPGRRGEFRESPSWKKSRRLFEVPEIKDDSSLPPPPPPSPPVFEELVWNLSSPKCWAGAFYVRSPGMRVGSTEETGRGGGIEEESEREQGQQRQQEGVESRTPGEEKGDTKDMGVSLMTKEEEEYQRNEERKIFSQWWTKKQKLLAYNQPNFEWTVRRSGGRDRMNTGWNS